jgi:Tfp pilus assembly protein PilV
MSYPARRARPGFTVIETMLAVGVLTVALVMVAQVAAWSLTQRERAAVRQEALEQAANVLEKARSLPWDQLTPEWAAAQKLPEALSQRLDQPVLAVRVQAIGAAPLTRKVTVEVRWKQSDTVPAPPVRLEALFSARSAATTGGKP